jgi:hypothetical protein
MDSRFKEYVIEPINADGTFNAQCRVLAPLKGKITADTIADYYFSKNAGIVATPMDNIFDWYKLQGWRLRVKTW